jgi:type IX secretion system PorP/SprF family membrane protein
VCSSDLVGHFYLMGGYKYRIDREWAVEPGLIISKVVPAQYQLEINCKTIYKNMLWAGLSYRTQDAVSFVMGYTYERKIYFGYAYDFATTDIRKYSYGSQEIVIGYNFDSIKRMAKKKK